jgi:hypothetical protein
MPAGFLTSGRRDMAGFDSWVAKAGSVAIEHELERRGVKLRRAGAELTGPCPKCAGCDRFGVNTQKQHRNCRGCTQGGDVIDLVRHLDSVDFIAACVTLTGDAAPERGGAAYPSNNRATVQPGLTLEQYSAAKALPIDFLREHGLSDVTLTGRSAVRMAYLGADGAELAVRFRIALTGDRFRWKSASKPCLYGLNRIGDAWLRARATSTPSGTMAYRQSDYRARRTGERTATPSGLTASKQSMS